MSGNKVSIEIPTGLDLVLDPAKIYAAAGNKGAKMVREKMRASGDLNQTETLIKSTRYMPTRVRGANGRLTRSRYQGGLIYPRGKRPRPDKKSPKTAERNMAILSILLFKYPHIRALAPMTMTPEIRAAMVRSAQVNMNNQRKKLFARKRKRV